MTELQKKDVNYNWHPYTQHQTSPLPIVIVKGKNSLLWDESGYEYIDAIASWWANPHGHCNQAICDAITEQINTLEHVLFGGFTHPTAIHLSEQLLAVLPSNQTKIFYSDNGSTAVEVALKMALQYHYNNNEDRSTIIAFENAFHGDTFGAMAASGISFFTEAFKHSLLTVERIPLPTIENFEPILNQLKGLIKTKKPAAFIFEPLIQGAAGMQMYAANHLDGLIALCKENNVLTIADEVMTGFGRTGKLFASDYLTEKPDIICLSKALTGGFIPLAVTSCTQDIFDAFLSNEVGKALFHGHTFMANPAGCSAALASLKLSLSIDTKQKIKEIESQHKIFIEELKRHKKVKNTRTLGVILAFDIIATDTAYYGDLRQKMYNYFISERVILRPVGNTVYILPAYCITSIQMQKIYGTILNLLNSNFL